MWKTCVRSLGWEALLEEGLATHPSILAWRIPCREEPGGLHTAHGVAKSRTRLSYWTQHSRANRVHLQTISSCPLPALNSKFLINALCFLEKFQVCIKIDQKVHWVLIWPLCLRTHTHTHTNTYTHTFSPIIILLCSSGKFVTIDEPILLTIVQSLYKSLFWDCTFQWILTNISWLVPTITVSYRII